MILELCKPLTWLGFAGGCLTIAISLHHFIIKDVVRKVARRRGALNEKVKSTYGVKKKFVPYEDIPKVFYFINDNERILSRVEFFAKWCWLALLGCSAACFLAAVLSFFGWLNLEDPASVKKLVAWISVIFLFSALGIFGTAHWGNSNPDES